MFTPHCTIHPHSQSVVTGPSGPAGPGVYPQCVPPTAAPPHLLSWDDERSASGTGSGEIFVSRDLARLVGALARASCRCCAPPPTA